ncbi:MAG: type I 3-dehydroquinate dehydratase [Chloroflexi bacterium]|nr:type I 3-dehydroquinate dehydratase [Chloroflexota bacterium]
MRRPEARKPVQLGSVLLGGRYPLICVAVAACDIADVIASVERAAATECDLLEIRLDYVHDLDPDAVPALLDRLRTITPFPLIITNRSAEEGGANGLAEEVRVASLIAAIDSGADAVDIELGTGVAWRDQVIQEACCRNVPVIVSYHDFSGTPSQERLVEIVKQEIAAGGSIAKFAVMTRTPADVLAVLGAAYQARTQAIEEPLIAIGMGPLGVQTRVVGPVYGSDLSFASGARATALGQLSPHDLRDLMRAIAPGLLP